MLNLSGKGIGSSGMKSLAESCSNPRPSRITSRPRKPYRSPLVCCWLENNDLTDRSMVDLARLLSLSPGLRHLHLSHNFVGDAGMRTVAKAIFTQLQCCYVAENNIGPKGARTIADQLKSHDCKLSTLDLDGNRLRDEGLMEILKGLTENTSLKTLDLRYNNITLKGLLALRDMLASGDNLVLEVCHLEEDIDDDCLPAELNQTQPFNKTERMQYPQRCHCARCEVKTEIAYYLDLNHAGRHSFTDLSLVPALWPFVLAKSMRDPSLLHAILTARPDVAMRQKHNKR